MKKLNERKRKKKESIDLSRSPQRHPPPPTPDLTPGTTSLHKEAAVDMGKDGDKVPCDIKEEDIEIKEEPIEEKQEVPQDEDSGSTAQWTEKRVLFPDAHLPQAKKHHLEMEQVWIKEEPPAEGGPVQPAQIRPKFTYAQKNEIINLLESGKQNCGVAKQLGVNESTIQTIQKDRQKIKIVIKGSADEYNLVEVPGSNTVLEANEKLTSHSVERRDKLNSIHLQGEVGSGNTKTAPRLSTYLSDIIKEGGYTADQIFNMYETTVYWKQMPKRNYLYKISPIVKFAKDKVMLLLSSNSAGTHKLKPLLVHRAKHWHGKRDLQELNVHWRQTKKGCMTPAISLDWFDKCFVPDVELFCKSQNINFNILFLLEDAPGYSPYLIGRHPNINVVFLWPSTTSLQQSLELMATFKAVYTSKFFARLHAKTQGEKINMMEKWSDPDDPQGPKTGFRNASHTNQRELITVLKFWKSYNIQDAVDLMVESWNEMSQTTIHHARNTLEVLSVHELDVRGEPQLVVEAIQRAVVAAQRVPGLFEVQEADVREMIM